MTNRTCGPDHKDRYAPDAQTTIRAVSSLLSTMTLIGLCGGMTSTLLGLRGTMEGFSTVTIGLIMSAYFVGYLFGATRAPKTFAGLAIFVPLVA